jgi:hypothetical protein
MTMLKKIVLGTLLIGLVAILAAGAIVRTIDKTGNVAEARGMGGGRGAGAGSTSTTDRLNGGGGYGRNTTATVERLYPNYQNPPEEWATYEGTVMTAPQPGVNMVLQAADGQEITVGMGPTDLEDQGLALQAGEQVRVYGYWEDGEFKAAQVTRLRDGQAVTLRDQLGRPAWAGGGQAASRGAYGGDGNTDAPGDGTGTGQAQVDEWLTLAGTVSSVDADALIIETAGGEQVTVENRAWWFALDQGFEAQAGDEVTVVGFYEDGDFEVSQIDDTTTGQTVQIRDENGRPLWAGRGRRGA